MAITEAKADVGQDLVEQAQQMASFEMDDFVDIRLINAAYTSPRACKVHRNGARALSSP